MGRQFEGWPADLNTTIRQMQAQMLEYARDLRRVFAAERARRLELEQINKQLEDSARRRADLISLLAHELRTPVTALVGYLELLADGSFGPLGPTQSAPVEKLVRRANDLARLVAELGQYAALASDAAPTRPGPLADLAEHLHHALGPVRALADEREVELEVQVAIEAPEAHVDLGLVTVIAVQLADNAVKFGRAGGLASVIARQVGPILELGVEDDGPGLPESVRGRLFQEFNVGDDLVTRSAGGLGLGLPIVAHAARSLGASIAVATPNGRGTRFEAKIPVRSPDPA